jgi:hypothetical protein
MFLLKFAGADIYFDTLMFIDLRRIDDEIEK